MWGNVLDHRNIKRKICLLGDPAVGKTSLIRKFIFDIFSDDYISTVGTKVSKKEIEMEIQKLNLKITLTLMVWDILGQSGYKSLHSMFYRGASGAIIVADGTRSDSVQSLEKWTRSLNKVVNGSPIIYLINKDDLVRHPDFRQNDLDELGEKYGAVSLSTSAKTGLNVENAFNSLSKLLIRDYLGKNY